MVETPLGGIRVVSHKVRYMGARSQVSGMLDQLDQLDRRFDISTFHIFV